MERERGNEDRKEKKQHDRSTAEEPERDPIVARPEESPQNPEETTTEKSEGEYNGRQRHHPKPGRERGTGQPPRKTPATRA